MKRIAVPVSDELFDAVTILAGIEGGGRGRILAEFLSAVEPGLIAAASAHQMAQTLRGKELEAHQRKMQQLAAQLEEMIGFAPNDLSDRVAEAVNQLAGGAREAGRGSRAADDRAPSQPPHTNRGVRNEV